MNSRFSVAVHILTLLHASGGEPVTSEYIAGSVNTNASFVRRMNGRRLAYTLRGGRAQHVRVYVARASAAANHFALFMHGSHALMDAKPTIQVLGLLLGWMAAGPEAVEREEPAMRWGTEHENLAVGPVEATGGPRDDWDTAGAELMRRVVEARSNPKVRGLCGPCAGLGTDGAPPSSPCTRSSAARTASSRPGCRSGCRRSCPRSRRRACGRR